MSDNSALAHLNAKYEQYTATLAQLQQAQTTSDAGDAIVKYMVAEGAKEPFGGGNSAENPWTKAHAGGGGCGCGNPQPEGQGWHLRHARAQDRALGVVVERR